MKIKILILSIILLLFFCVGCSKQDSSPVIDEPPTEEQSTELRADSIYGILAPSYFCGYRSDKREFEIDNVELDFYYGGGNLKNPEELISHLRICVSFYDATNNYASNKGVIIKEFDPLEYVSEGYYSSDYFGVRYNHETERRDVERFEKITIPSELFIHEKGRISFNITEIDIEGKGSMSAGVSIYYRKDGNKIILSSKSFDSLN